MKSTLRAHAYGGFLQRRQPADGACKRNEMQALTVDFLVIYSDVSERL
jgi:hypothetical protein